jgi:three-Cys-motif partner protein
VGGNRVDHSFGGGWTEIKLNAVSDYLKFYTSALANQPSPETPFETWYIDAFAGTGDRTVMKSSGGLLEGTPHRFDPIRLQGSARRALQVDPPFRHFVFIENNPARFKALETVRSLHPDRDIKCLPRDANIELPELFSKPPWNGPRSSLQRAVVFLDPYGMSVRWATLKRLADTKRVDIWYLFPVQAVLRQLAHDHRALDDSKRSALTEIFGTDAWEHEFYQPRKAMPSLFGGMVTPQPTRRASADQVNEFASERLEKLFPYVSEPIPILTRRKLPEFSLFCLSANPSPIAINLIKRGVAAQIKKYGRSN